jgi:hypothetical protein
MIADFNTLFALDLTGKTNKKTVSGRTEVDYLNWAVCVSLLHENGAKKVLFGNVHQNDHPLFLKGEALPFVRVYVDVDGDRRELDYPVIDGFFDVKMDKIEQSDVHNATQRGFVKCVGINWGLGLPLWIKEESAAPQKDNLLIHNIWSIKKRLDETITAKMQKKGIASQKELCDAIGWTEKAFTQTMTIMFDNIAKLEDLVKKI